MKTKTILIFLLFILTTTSIHLGKPKHNYSIKTSQIISQGIKEQLLSKLGRIANVTAAEELRKDLQQTDRQNYQMTSIDALTANQIFGIFELQDPQCDQSGDGYLTGLQLRCLNKLWKYYVPKDS